MCPLQANTRIMRELSPACATFTSAAKLVGRRELFARLAIGCFVPLPFISCRVSLSLLSKSNLCVFCRCSLAYFRVRAFRPPVLVFGPGLTYCAAGASFSPSYSIICIGFFPVVLVCQLATRHAGIHECILETLVGMLIYFGSEEFCKPKSPCAVACSDLFDYVVCRLR